MICRHILPLLSTLPLLCGVAANAATPQGAWEVNAADWRYDMSLWFDLANADGTPMDAAGWQVGAFADGECRGLSTTYDLPDGTTCGYMRIRSNDATAPQIEFRMRPAGDADSDGELLYGVALPFESDKAVGLPSAPCRLVYTDRYEVTYMVGSEIWQTAEVYYGAPLDSPDAPAREGYTFVGWEDAPDTMPGHDITLDALYAINHYTLSLYVDEVLYHSEELEYDAPVEVETPEVPAGKRFAGWDAEVPERMPAHDVTLHAILTDLTGVWSPTDAPAASTGQCYDLLGRRVSGDSGPGVYIRGGKFARMKNNL